MDLPLGISYEETAIDIVVQVINAAHFALGERLTLCDLVQTRKMTKKKSKIHLVKVTPPIVVTSKKLIKETIEKQWQLNSFLYCLKDIKNHSDRLFSYYFFEAIFSQPTVEYPIPQVTASIFFKVVDSHDDVSPAITFWLEGHYSEYDIRHVLVTEDWIARVLAMKMITFKRFLELKF